LSGGEPELDAQSYLRLTLWLLGCPDQAMACHAKALRIASEVTHAHSRAYALAFAGVQHQLRSGVRRVAPAGGRVAHQTPAWDPGTRQLVSSRVLIRIPEILVRGDFNNPLLNTKGNNSALPLIQVSSHHPEFEWRRAPRSRSTVWRKST